MGACCTSGPTEAPEINANNSTQFLTGKEGQFSAKIDDKEAAATRV